MTMGGFGGGMPGMGPGGMMSSLRRDSSAAKARVAPGTVRRIAAFAQPFRGKIAAFLVTVVVSSALVVASPLLVQRLIDDGVVPGNRRLVITLALIIAALAFADAGIGLVQRWFSARIGEGLIFDLRTRVFGHVQRQPVAFFTRTQTGALVSRLNTDVIGAQQAFTTTLSSVVSNIVSLVMVGGAMLVLSWQITSLVLLLLPVFFLPARRVGRKVAGLTRESMQLNATLSNRSTERFNVAGALLVNLFGRRHEEDHEYASLAARVRDIGVRIAMVNRIFFSSLTLVAALASALVYGLGGVMAINGQLTVGTLLAMTALLGRLYGPITSLANVRVDIMTALVSFERVFEVLDLDPLIQDPEQPQPIPSGSLSVEFDHVGFVYPTAKQISIPSMEALQRSPLTAESDGAPVLTDVTLAVPAGRTLALVGPSGAGKTTMTTLVTRLYDVSSGSVRVGGVDVRDVALEQLRDRVGNVTQEAHMFHDTVRANLLFAKPAATDQELEVALRASQAWSVVQSLPQGLDTLVGDRGHRLSGGEKQRLALARVLLKAPSVVVLDEATAHLDAESESAVKQALNTVLTDRTAIVIAHRLSTILDADEIAVVVNGRIAERGTHHELLARGGAYADLYRTQLAPQERDSRPVQLS